MGTTSPIQAVHEEIDFHNNNKKISVKIDSGYVTLGSYSIFYTCKDLDPVYITKNADFNGPSNIHEIPIELNEIENCSLFIKGKYRPAPGHNQIKVYYTFHQNEEEIHKTEIKETSEKPFARCEHSFEFKEKD